MNITLDIKTLIVIAGIVATLGGFYYSTQHRLDTLEDRVELIQVEFNTQAAELKQLRRLINKKHKK